MSLLLLYSNNQSSGSSSGSPAPAYFGRQITFAAQIGPSAKTRTPANLPMAAGETPLLVFLLSVTSGAPFSAAGAAAIFTLGTAPGAFGSQIVVNRSTASAPTLCGFGTDQMTGLPSFSMQFQQADTRNLPPGVYFWQVLIVEANGDQSIALAGTVTLSPSMTAGW